MKRIAFGLIVLFASLTQAQTAPVLTRANRQQVVDSLNAVMQKQTDNVAYAEITGDTLTVHSERASDLRFHALLANKALITEFQQIELTTFVYTNDKDQKFVYDVKAQPVTPAPPVQPVAAPVVDSDENWHVAPSSTDALTGEVMLTASTEAIDFSGPAAQRPRLAVRYHGKQCELLMYVPYTVLEEGGVRVRIDGGKIEYVAGSRSTDMSSVFFLPKGKFGRLASASTMVVEYQPYQQRPSSVTFNVKGLPSMFDPCK